ncbi:hypothetical protein SCHPADRAFT_943837 [Schizopora paradoxa]|uniref:Uncharacterized protein n=1 Tax=Schizopora paradoxa TaxID=27342 RepID=A0A0H2RBG1_9AGAM|nr:hypothetical protein SCHPADRAFT_943837 [Schizopora paradoxa]
MSTTTTTTNKSIALFGSFTEEFSSELRKDGFELVQNTEAKSDLSDYAIVAVSGVENGFDHHAHLADILKAGKILVAFEPSEDFLAVLHSATKTPIDLTKIEATGDRPLIIHPEHGAFRVILPVTDSTPSIELVGTGSDDGSQVEVLEEEIKNQVGFTSESTPTTRADVIVKFLNDALDSITQSDKEPRDTNNLDPGNDVAFYKHSILTFAFLGIMNMLAWNRDGQENVPSTDASQNQVYLMTWNISVYAYATNANPTGATPENYKGTIYTYMIHDNATSSLVRTPAGAPRWYGPFSSEPGKSNAAFYFVDYLEYLVKDPESKLRKVTEQPVSSQGQRDDSNGFPTYRYNISQKQNMTLFRKNQNQTFVFSAEIEKPVAFPYFELHNGGTETQGSVITSGFSLAYNDYYNYWADPKYSTSAWWDPGVYTDSAVKRLPDDNHRLDGLTVYSSSVGSFFLDFTVAWNMASFKDRHWVLPQENGTGRRRILVYRHAEQRGIGLDLENWG